MRVLVTGGAGFIGSHVCDAFIERGDEVWALDDLSHGHAARLPEGAELVTETVLNASAVSELVARTAPETICHLAAQVDVRVSVASPARDAEVNVLGTINVLEAARRANARVVFVSTGGALYGERAPIPSVESTPPEPGSPYGVAKFCAEQYVGLYNRLYGTEHAILRFANVYGPRQGASGEAGVVSVFCGSSIRGEPLTIYGDGKQTRDYVYVGDCVTAVLAAADYGKAGVWNVGSGSEVNVLDLATLVAQLTGNSSQPVFAPARTGELARSALACAQARQDLQWQPGVPLTEGVQAVVNWFEAGAPDRE